MDGVCSHVITLDRRGSGFVIRVDYARWGQTPEDLRHLALSAPHARTRERALAAPASGRWPHPRAGVGRTRERALAAPASGRCPPPRAGVGRTRERALAAPASGRWPHPRAGVGRTRER